MNYFLRYSVIYQKTEYDLLSMTDFTYKVWGKILHENNNKSKNIHENASFQN